MVYGFLVFCNPFSWCPHQCIYLIASIYDFLCSVIIKKIMTLLPCWNMVLGVTRICGHKTRLLIFDSRINSVPLNCVLASTLKNGSLLKESRKAAVSGMGSDALRPWQHGPSHPSACVVPSALAPLLSSTSHSDSYCDATSWGLPRLLCLTHPTALHLAVEYSKAKSKGVLL